MTFPLHFFDFETYGSAVPKLDRTGPHKQLPVQYSLHILAADGTLTHREYLEREARLPDRLLERMRADILPEGTILSWHATFERDRNNDMAALYQEAADFLQSCNGRMADLEDVFKTDYVDAQFEGSTSIKKVLPIVCPDLNYEDLEIGEGASAMESWEQMVARNGEESEKLADALLKYCRRDTLAMVRIYRFLEGVVGD